MVRLACLLLVLALPACRRLAPEEPDTAVPASEPGLVEITSEVNLTFQHDPGPLSGYDMPQVMGSGAALFDYDNDGDLDALLINGGPLQPDERGEMPWNHTSRLFRQEENGVFVDVTAEAAIAHRGYGMGVAVGDADNDGDVDVYLTNYGPDQLFLNSGDGHFVDAGDAAGIRNPQWATAAAFVDYDRDGWLDLFVVNYVDYLPGSICEDAAGRRDFCGPESLAGTVDKLYRNLGADGKGLRFEDVTVASGIAAHAGKGLGLMCRDFTGDGRPDFYVANDMEDNCFWIQQDNGQFINEAHLRGVAVNHLGEPEASMGVANGDVDDDGHADLLLTHLSGETNTLYIGDSAGQFVDKTTASGLGEPSRPVTGFGVGMIDLEHDGDLDVVLVNGRVKRGPAALKADTEAFWRDYAEPNHVYMNDGRGQFARVAETAPHGRGVRGYGDPIEVSRGLAYGDIDNDGDLDVLISNCGGPARLYRNEYPKRGHWLLVRCLDTDLQRDAYGARLFVEAGGKTFMREINPSSSYLSSHDVRAHFGLGEAAEYDRITVEWPSAEPPEVFEGGSADRQITLTRGTGRPVAEPRDSEEPL